MNLLLSGITLPIKLFITIPDNHELKMASRFTIPALQVTLVNPRHMTSSLDIRISLVYATSSRPTSPAATLVARNKVPRHKPYGPLQSLPVPSQPWRSLSMDAIIELPLSQGYDSIMIFGDRFTKQAHSVPIYSKGIRRTNSGSDVQTEHPVASRHSL